MTEMEKKILENFKTALSAMNYAEQYDMLTASKALAMLSTLRANSQKKAG